MIIQLIYYILNHNGPVYHNKNTLIILKPNKWIFIFSGIKIIISSTSGNFWGQNYKLSDFGFCISELQRKGLGSVAAWITLMLSLKKFMFITLKQSHKYEKQYFTPFCERKTGHIICAHWYQAEGSFALASLRTVKELESGRKCLASHSIMDKLFTDNNKFWCHYHTKVMWKIELCYLGESVTWMIKNKPILHIDLSSCQ